MTTNYPSPSRRWEATIPRTIVILAVALSLSLATMLWFVYRAVENASVTLQRGQASAFIAEAQEWLRSFGRRPQPGDFDGFLATHWDAGLRYIALVRPGTTVLETQSGTPAAALDDPVIRHLRPMSPERIAGRIRVMLGPPDFPPGRPNAPPWGSGPPPDGAGPMDDGWGRPDRPPPPPGDKANGPDDGLPRRPPPPPKLIVEFEPLPANQMRGLAQQTLWIGLLTVSTFLGGAIFLAFLIRQREQLARRLDHQGRLVVLGEMAAVIAHEIRNPLTSLKGHAQLLVRSLPGDAREEKAQRVVGDAVRLEALLNDLLDFARSGAIEPRPVDPVRLLADCADAVHPGRIVIHGETAPATWRMDVSRMSQALTNVLRNAVQISPEDAPVQANVFTDHGHLVFEVRDTGPGIPVGDEQRIFEPFYTRKARGTGLGLSLAQRIVVQHRGTISARNDPNGGAVFRIALTEL